MDLLGRTLFSTKYYLQSSHYKNYEYKNCFLSSPPFLLLALSFSPFLFLCYYDFKASQA